MPEKAVFSVFAKTPRAKPPPKSDQLDLGRQRSRKPGEAGERYGMNVDRWDMDICVPNHHGDEAATLNGASKHEELEKIQNRWGDPAAFLSLRKDGRNTVMAA